MAIGKALAGWLVFFAMGALPACAGHQAGAVDPACARGLELMGSDMSEEQMQEARSLFQASCELGSGTGCLHLALLWERGIGGLEDQQYALQLLQRSCDLGQSQACSLLHSRIKMNEWETGDEKGMSIMWP